MEPTAEVTRHNPYAGLPQLDAQNSRVVARRLLEAAGYRDDAALTAAFARELEYRFAEVFKVEYPEFKATQFIPVDTEVPPGALSFTYRMIDKVGDAEIISNYAADLPTADIIGKEWPQPVVTIGSSYNFNVQDIASAAMANLPIESLKADAARFAIEFKLEKIAALGDANSGIVGIANAPGVAAVAKVSTGTWPVQIAASLTNAVPAILSDVFAMMGAVFNGTNSLYEPTDMLVPVDVMFALRSAARSPLYTQDTLLQYLKEITGLTISPWPVLNNAGAGAKGRIVVYKKDPKVLKLIIPQPFTQYAPQAVNLAYRVPCVLRTGGVTVRHPKAVVYMDGAD